MRRKRISRTKPRTVFEFHVGQIWTSWFICQQPCSYIRRQSSSLLGPILFHLFHSIQYGFHSFRPKCGMFTASIIGIFLMSIFTSGQWSSGSCSEDSAPLTADCSNVIKVILSRYLVFFEERFALYTIDSVLGAGCFPRHEKQS